MKSLTIAALFLLAASCVFGQMLGNPVGEPAPQKAGIDAAQQHLNPITVSQFEDASFWTAFMPSDQGRIEIRRLNGVPGEKKQLDADRLKQDQAVGIPDGGSVLGVKVDFIKRGKDWFTVTPSRPLAIEGISKTLSVWVVGRNFNHTLKILLGDYFGNKREITVGKLNFLGWKRLTVAIPPSITQADYHYVAKNGIQFMGFRIDCDMDESFGRYYMYFDDLSAVSDLFLEKSRDQDDMQDIW
jgi:hypothetical protein